jgi:hypothetical protein
MHEFKVEYYANFGTGEPWVARIVLGLKELVYAVPSFGATREAFMNELGEVFESLGMAFEELRDLRKLTAEDAPALDITRVYASLYGYLWQAYKDRFQAATKALGLDIGFLFQNDANFEKGATRLVAVRPELVDVINVMRRDRSDFQTKLSKYRNDYLEHRVEKPDPKLIAQFHRLDSAENTFENVWQAIEDYVALFVIASLPPAIRVIEIPEELRDPSRPTRFRFALQHAPGTAV